MQCRAHGVAAAEMAAGQAQGVCQAAPCAAHGAATRCRATQRDDASRQVRLARAGKRRLLMERFLTAAGMLRR